MKDVWSTFWLIVSVKCSMLGRLFTNSGLYSIWKNFKSDSRKHGQKPTCMDQHLLNHFCISDHRGFLQDDSLTFVYKLTKLIPLKTKEYWRSTLRQWYHLGLILKKVSGSFITNIIRFKDKDFLTYHWFLLSFYLQECFLFVVTIFSIICCYFFIIVIIIIIIIFMVFITKFIFISFCFYYYNLFSSLLLPWPLFLSLHYCYCYYYDPYYYLYYFYRNLHYLHCYFSIIKTIFVTIIN